MTPKEIEFILESPIRLREYCIDQGIGILEARKLLEKTKTTSKNSPDKKSPTSRTSSLRILHSTDDKTEVRGKKEKLDKRTKNLINKNPINKAIYRHLLSVQDNDKTTSLDSFIEDITNHEINSTLTTPLMGEISNTLYTLAEFNAYDGKKTKELSNKRINHPITSKNICDYLEIDLSNKDIDHITGILSTEYVKENYTIEDGQIKQIGKDGNALENTKIEGTNGWSGEEKDQTRELLSNYVKQYLINPKEQKISSLKKELRVAHKEQNRKISEMEKFNNEEISTDLTFEGNNKQIKKILKKLKNDANINNLKINKGYGKLSIKNIGQKTTRRISNLFKEEGSNLKGISTNLGEIKANFEKHATLEGKLTQLNSTIPLKEKELESIKSINYLGLEGPGLASFLKMNENSSCDFEGLFFETNHRNYNLTKSMIDANMTNGKCKVINENLDDAILLDFVKNKDVKLSGNSDNLEVEYMGESISLDNYHTLLKNLNNNLELEEFNRLSKEYNISKDFLNIITQREEGKFDIIFLDYIGPMTKRRKRVMDKLIESRLSDNAIVASTFNADKRLNHRNANGLEHKLVTDEIFDTWTEIFDSKGYNIENFDIMDYTGNSDNMSFQIYHIVQDENTIPINQQNNLLKTNPLSKDEKIRITGELYNCLTPEQIVNKDYTSIYSDERLKGISTGSISSTIAHHKMGTYKERKND